MAAMRLRWALALPRGLWGGPQVAQSMWQHSGRPAQDPSEDPSGDLSGPLAWRSPPSGSQEEDGGSAAFAAVLAALEQRPGRRVGRLELVEAALAAMPALGVARQREAYHRLLRLLPCGPWVPRGPLQRMLSPFPRQQECGLQILEQMERYGTHVPAQASCPMRRHGFCSWGSLGPAAALCASASGCCTGCPGCAMPTPTPCPPGCPPPAWLLPTWACAASPTTLMCASPSTSGRCRRAGKMKAPSSPTSSVPRALTSRSCWPGMARHGPSSWRGHSLSGCAAPASATTCYGGTPCLPTCGRSPQTLSAASTTPCISTWTWSVALGTMTTSMWMKWRKALSLRCAWRGPVTGTRWASGLQGCKR
ncbi:evolutionarily conserved signaling intermediate in Toll pathway, mitochondrial isoform X2 [Falco peregrinus]|uniref:evolutionarily conserved signaling intermediate in Toll pathway, mitochondrial isoform X2 n=1 Tax=Falco peregrinus TaxID=8954 RepID=UPI002479073C|nr:evolutionarily conserved signaling intermediate in Toll pathway, mitochondrial isoform X2 [Falco peregrinus]